MGFTGVSIETMCLFVSSKQKPDKTVVYNMKFNKKYVQSQAYITDTSFPYFIVYRDKNFDEVANKLEFGVFDVFRDRQLTKGKMCPKERSSSIWVIKARNINDDGSGVTHIDGYDAYIDKTDAQSLSVYQFVDNTDVYLTPNMTYNPRVIENIPNVIPDGSVAVLIPKGKRRVTKKQRLYFSSEEYRAFYTIARNLSTQSINVDKASVFFYGVLNNCLICKTDSIRKDLMDNQHGQTLYTFVDFMFVLDTGFSTDYFCHLDENDFEGVLSGIDINYRI